MDEVVGGDDLLLTPIDAMIGVLHDVFTGLVRVVTDPDLIIKLLLLLLLG